MVTEELLDAYKKQSATRVLQRLLKGREYSRLDTNAIKPGDEVLFFYRSSKQNEADEWKSGTVTKVSDHIVGIRRPGSRLDSKVALEDIRLRPDSELARELSEAVMEGYIDLTLHSDSENEPATIDGACEALMTHIDTEAVRKDFGDGAEELLRRVNIVTQQSLTSSEQQVLKDISTTIGSRQVTTREMQFAPPWILKKATDKEHTDNWKNAYTEVEGCEVPDGANIISSHTVFRIKQDENENLKLKARLVAHGNRDDMKDEVQKDCSNAEMIVVRLLVRIALCLGFNFGVADVKGAYLQSGPIQRDIYIRPPKEFGERKGFLWKLTKLPYGIADAGRQWAKRIETWMLGSAGLTRVFGVNQLFTERSTSGKITLIVAKFVDDLLVEGSTASIASFMRKLQAEFEVGKVRIESMVSFAGCSTEQDEEGNVTISMKDYLKRLIPVDISRPRRRDRDSAATPDEVHEYRSLAGTLMYLGSGVLPQASFVTSRMQQELGSLKVAQIIEANAMLLELMQFNPSLRFIRPLGVSAVALISMSDASHGSNSNSYGQTGIIAGRKIETCFDDDPSFHPLYCVSNKQRRVAYSSFGAEILACADAEDRGIDMKYSLQHVFPTVSIPHEIFINSKALFDTITTLHEPKEYRLRKTVTLLRDAFEAGELDQLSWIPGTKNIADALTKRSIQHARTMNQMLVCGLWKINTDAGMSHGSDTGK